MERQNLGKRNILYVSSSALRRFISPKTSNDWAAFCLFLRQHHVTSLFVFVLFSSLSPSFSLCILYPSFSFLVLSIYSIVTNFHPHTHSESCLCFYFFFPCQNMLLSVFIQFLQKVYFKALFAVHRNQALQISHTVSPSEVATRLA